MRILILFLAIGLAGCSTLSRIVGRSPSPPAAASPEHAKPMPGPAEPAPPAKTEPAAVAPAVEKPVEPVVAEPTPVKAPTVPAPPPAVSLNPEPAPAPPPEAPVSAIDAERAEQPQNVQQPVRRERPAPVAGASPAPLGKLFNREVRLLYRIVACAGDEPLPRELEPVVSRHCKAFLPTILDYKKKYLPEAQPFLVALQPKGLPTTVVYPFGGGDLLSALTTYPSLREVTTLSLEHAGDPQGIVAASPMELDKALERVRRRVSGLLIWTESTSENMIQLQQGGIPGQLAFFLVGLAVHDQEPVSLRFFDIDNGGAVVGLTAEDIETRKTTGAQKLNPWWKDPDFSDAFSNSEITFRKAGDPKGQVRVHRHIAVNLSNDGLKSAPGILKHLKAKGRISAMTKAASYLLWSLPFSGISNYLLSSMEFMLSDSTGIPPKIAKRAGFDVIAYGTYEGAFLPAPATAARDMLVLFESQPVRELKFRYGYPDIKSHHHLLVTRKREQQAASITAPLPPATAPSKNPQ